MATEYIIVFDDGRAGFADRVETFDRAVSLVEDYTGPLLRNSFSYALEVQNIDGIRKTRDATEEILFESTKRELEREAIAAKAYADSPLERTE